jgi:hypothetical protein
MKCGVTALAIVYASGLALAATACSSEEVGGSRVSHTDDSGSSGSGGTGLIYLPDSGADAAGGSSATGGSSGGGFGGAPPAAPNPTLNCATQTGNHCISAAGFIDGVPFDFSCTADLGGYRVKFLDSYGLNCWEETTQPFSFSLSIPLVDPGPFQVAIPNESGGAVQLRFSDTRTNEGADHSDPNFASGTVSGTLTRTTTDTLMGTFEATWLGGGSACSSCVPVSIRGTFRSVFDF